MPDATETSETEFLSQMRQLLESQDAQWSAARAELDALGDVEFALSELPTFRTHTQPLPCGVRA
jgi:hypothetical protein